jgi:hypothetical protein
LGPPGTARWAAARWRLVPGGAPGQPGVNRCRLYYTVARQGCRKAPISAGTRPPVACRHRSVASLACRIIRSPLFAALDHNTLHCALCGTRTVWGVLAGAFPGPGLCSRPRPTHCSSTTHRHRGSDCTAIAPINCGPVTAVNCPLIRRTGEKFKS